MLRKLLFLFPLLVAIGVLAWALLAIQRPGVRETRGANQISQGFDEAQRASLRERGLPESVPEKKTEWMRFCEAWPEHKRCQIMMETGFPFSKRNMMGQCAYEKRLREQDGVIEHGRDFSLRRTWRVYDENLTAETACAAYRIEWNEKTDIKG